MLEVNKIYCGDCLDIMRDMPDDSVFLTITDPDYNAKNIGPNKRKYDVCPMQREDYPKFCATWFAMCDRVSEAIVFTPGIANTHYYPAPFWQICWHKPASCSFNRMGGFNAWEPIFTYGKVTKARLGQDYILCNTLNLKKGPESKHPCPKPLKLMEKLVKHFSEPGDLIFDPFVGSGTTCLAAKRLGRNYIGIDISEEYCQIARDRLAAEQAGLTVKEMKKGQKGLFT